MKAWIISAALASGVLLALSLGAAPGAAQAHHCFTAEYDAADPLTVKGTIVTVEWVNPHTLIYVAGAEDGKEPRTYAFSGATPNTLLRAGVTRDMLRAGAALTISGYRTKNKTCAWSETAHAATCRADGRRVIMPGRVFSVGSSGTNAPEDMIIVFPPGAGAPKDGQSAVPVAIGGPGWCGDKSAVPPR